jgi:hypothetical protein
LYHRDIVNKAFDRQRDLRLACKSSFHSIHCHPFAASSMPDEIPINATYASSPTSLKHLPYILSSLNSQFPLRNLHWKSATRPSVKTIQECDVKLHKLSEAQTKSEQWKLPAAVQAGSLVRGCLVHICFVECEVSLLWLLI